VKTKRLAEKLGVSQKTVQNWCNGRNRPRMEYVIDMAKLFEITIEGMYEITKG
jgi:DNA-binding XRE family transcriptional regulator